MSVDLRVSYLGLELDHPLLPGASPLVDDMDEVKKLQDAGAPAFIMHSLFEEQLTGEELGAHHQYEAFAEGFGEAQSFMPEPSEFALGPYEYLEQLQRIKEVTGLPVIGSLNGSSASGWLHYAKLIQEAGADALELNIYRLAVDPQVSGAQIEDELTNVVKTVTNEVTCPVAVKLSPFYSSVANVARQVVASGAKALVLFNRFYQPDFDIEALEIIPALRLSTSDELRLRLQWLAILKSQLETELSVTGGVHTTEDVVKSILAGANTVQLVSTLLKNGPGELGRLRKGLEQWLEEHEYESVAQLRGALSKERCPDPEALERSNYLKVLQSWHR